MAKLRTGWHALDRLVSDQTGSLLPMAAIATLLLAGLMGGALDMSRAYQVKNRLQYACDAGVLAGRRAVESAGYNTPAQAAAARFFNANFDPALEQATNTSFVSSTPDNGNTIEAVARARVPTLLMRIFGYEEISLSAECTASMSVGNSDIVMVLDTTGSMAGTRIAALQTAMKNFYDTVAGATAGSNARVRYGFVPYSSTVNVGRLLSPEHLVNSITVQSRQWSTRTVRECGRYSCTDRQENYWLYKPVTYDVRQYKRFQSTSAPVGSNGSNVWSTWNGCIVERQTVATATVSFLNNAFTPSGLYDLDIDLAPDMNNPATLWAPMWSQVAYYRSGNPAESTSGTSGHPAPCPQAARLLAPMSETEFDNYTDSLRAEGQTYHDIGMNWGARLASPTGMFADNVNERPRNGGEIARHLIFMTDGQMDPSPTTLSAYGFEVNDRRITSDGTDSQATTRHNVRFRAVCQAVKAKGLRIWVIAFGTSLTTDLRNCASAQSAFTASDAAQLNRAFQEIAKNVGELRIVQ